MKKFLSLVLTATIIFSMNSFAFAADQSDQTKSLESVWVLKTFESGDKYLYNSNSGQMIVKAYTYDETGTLVEIDLNDYLDIKNSLLDVANLPTQISGVSIPLENDKELSYASDYSWVPSYRETNTYIGLGEPVKVTGDVVGPATVSHFNSSTVSHSFGGDVGMTLGIQSAIQASASFSWNVSLESEVSNGYAFPVPEGEIGYVQFTPYLNVTVGDLYYIYMAPFVYDEVYIGEVWGSSPKQIAGGFADGAYELILK